MFLRNLIKDRFFQLKRTIKGWFDFEFKKLFKNSSWAFLGNVVLVGEVFALSVILGRVLGVELFGTFILIIYFVETFVDTTKFKGICYQAANWLYLGKTTGFGKLDQTRKQNRSIKAVYGYPLQKNFRRLLCS